MLTSKQRATLRAQANGQPVLFQVGKEGVTENLIKQTQSALDARELIKLRTLEASGFTAREAADALAQGTGADVVQVIGSCFVLYLQKAKESAYAKML
ncbi:YhbY family RNA-binding protein [Ruminococcaceae bacterium OttesenSCG-928-N02]|nr:YhbY family RNA-binding protein [Ruminococcaceae bacterium OttesenSCG-928-N02]